MSLKEKLPAQPEGRRARRTARRPGWPLTTRIVLGYSLMSVLSMALTVAAVLAGRLGYYLAAAAALVLALAGSLVIGRFLTRRITWSLREVIRASRAIAAGNLDARIEPIGPPDLVALGRAINHMAEALQASRSQLQSTLEDTQARTAELEILARELQRNEEALYRQLKETTTLRDASLAVTSSLELEEVLVHIMQAVTHVVPVEAASLMLVDCAAQELVFEMSLMGDRLMREPFRIPLGVGIAGSVAQSGQPLLVPDVSKDPRFYGKIDQDTGFVTRAILCVPVVVRGETIGVIEVINRTEGRFTRDDQDLLGAFAASVGIAVENARLFQAAERERGRLQAILTGTADAIIATDTEGRVILANPAAEQAFGILFAEAAGRPIQESIPDPGLARAFQEARQGAGPSIPVQLALPDRRTLYTIVSPVAGPKGEGGWVAVMHDITHLKELDHMKGEFVSTVSHDLKTPLTAIRGYADLIATLGQVDEQQRQFIEKIKQVTDNMAQLIGDLLEIAKIEAGLELEIAPCSLQEICADVCGDLRFKAEGKGQTLEIELPAGLPPLCADRKRLRQVLANLLGNAVKYTPDGGHIRVTAEPHGDRVVARVQDDGIGIPPADLPYIFDKFYRVRRKEESQIEGTGLGLSIARSIVEQHGGQIWVESELGRGSTFFCSLPCSKDGRCEERRQVG